MSQSIIRRHHRTKSTDDETDDDKVKYLTPRKYRTTQRTQSPHTNNEIQLNENEYTLTPSKYRLNKFHEENTKLLYNKYPIIIGDFTLTKPATEDNSIYNYKPKHTQTSYVYQGIAKTSEVQERAINEIKQYAQSSSPIQKKIPFMNNKNHYQSMLNLPSNNYRSVTDDDLIRNHSRDSIYESIPRRNHSLSSLYPSNFSNKPIDTYDPYYFGEQSGYVSSDDEDEEEEEKEQENYSNPDEKFIIFGRNSQPKSIIQYSTFFPPPPPPIITNHIDIIFQEVADVGTSTDDILSDTATDDRRDQSLTQQQSLVTNQSYRSEMETYRVSRQIIDRDNYEEPDAVPFPIVKYPPSISTSSPSIIRLNKNPIQSKNYEMSSMDVDQSSKTKTVEQDNYNGEDVDDDEEEEKEEESHPSPPTPEPIRRLPRQIPIVDLPIPKYENIPINREPEQNPTHSSNKSDKSRRSFFNLFNRNKNKDDKSNNKKKDDKSKNKKKEKKKRKT